MTIRAKLYLAIALSVIGPVATIAVALYGMGQMGDRFDAAQERSNDRALALQLKFAITDVNGWQTAYGYDNGASRPEFDRAVGQFRKYLRLAKGRLDGPREQAQLAELDADFARFMRLDAIAFRALEADQPERVRQIFLGPEIQIFRRLASTAQDLATLEGRASARAQDAAEEERTEARRRMIAVALGAALVIALLLVTANDIARLALEGERRRDERV